MPDDIDARDPLHRRPPARMMRPVVHRSPSTLQRRLSGGGEHSGLAGRSAGGRLPRGLGDHRPRQSSAGRARPRVLSPLRRSL